MRLDVAGGMEVLRNMKLAGLAPDEVGAGSAPSSESMAAARGGHLPRAVAAVTAVMLGMHQHRWPSSPAPSLLCCPVTPLRSLMRCCT